MTLHCDVLKAKSRENAVGRPREVRQDFLQLGKKLWEVQAWVVDNSVGAGKT